MNTIENLEFAVLDADFEFTPELIGELGQFGQILQVSEICGGPATILEKLNHGAIYIDPLMGILVSRSKVLKHMSFVLQQGPAKITLAGQARLTRTWITAAASPINYPRFWYVDRLGGWSSLTGAGQSVAIIDTGLSAGHRCHPRLVPDLDFASLEAVGAPLSDQSGHGTNCAGVIAARSNCGERIAVAPDSRLVVGQVLPGHNHGSLFSVEWALLTSWALHCRGARVFSISLGVKPAGLGEYMDVDVYSNVALRLRRLNKALIFCAAGREGSMRYPAAAPGVIAVGGYVPTVEPGRVVADVSSGGIADLVKSELLLGPSTLITTTKTPDDADDVCAITDDFGGLSAACAFVAGVAVLYLERYPGMSLDQIVAQMIGDAECVPDPTGTRFFHGIRFPGAGSDRPC